MICDLEVQGGIPTPYNVVYANADNAKKDECMSANLGAQVREFKEAMHFMESMNFENDSPTPSNVVFGIVGDLGKYARFEELNTRRNSEIWLYKRIPLSFASSIMGLNGENISMIQQSCLASIILKPAPLNDMIIHINGGGDHEVDVAKILLEGCIGSRLDLMGGAFVQLCSDSDDEEEEEEEEED